jgi:hypothetical protein
VVAVPAEPAAVATVVVVPNGAAALPTAPCAAVAGVQRVAGNAGPLAVAAVAGNAGPVSVAAAVMVVVAAGAAVAVERGDASAAALAGVGPQQAGRRVGRPVAARVVGRRA